MAGPQWRPLQKKTKPIESAKNATESSVNRMSCMGRSITRPVPVP
jgi:hypothetical protein